MNQITFWQLLHAARRLKQRGWASPMRLAYLTGMLSVGDEVLPVNKQKGSRFRLAEEGAEVKENFEVIFGIGKLRS